MSKNKTFTEEQIEQMKQLESIVKSASDLCAFTMFHMQTGEFGIVTGDDEVAVGFFDRLKELYKNLSGDEDADRKFELEYVEYDGEPDGATGSTEADTREEGGVIRPRDRKLH